MVKVINIDTKTKTIHISNADSDIKTWRTTESGTHFPIREGESTKEALDKFVEKKKPETKKENPNSWTMGDGTRIEVKGDWVVRTDKNGQKSRISKKEWESLDDYGDAESGPLTREPSWQPAKKEPTVADRLNEGGWDNYGQWKPIKSGTHYYFKDEKNWAKRDYSYMYVPENDDDLKNYGEIEEDTFGRDFVTARIYENGKVVARERFDGADAKRDNMDFAIDYVVSHFKNKKKQEPAQSDGDGISGKYPEIGGIQQALWDARYIMDNYDDGEFGDSGTEYVWKDGTMYAVNITENSDGSAEAKMSSMGEVSQKEFAEYLDSIHSEDDEDEEEDDEDDSDISGIESRGEAADWLNAMTRKHGNTYFWSGNMKSALNKLVQKFGNTYFWNK